MYRILDDVRVLDATHVLAGPFATYQLAMLGAKVDRVENPRGTDFARRHGGECALREAGLGTSFLAQNANKRSLAMDLKHPQGKELFLALAKHADVVTENYRPGVMQRLGLGPSQLLEVNPRLVCMSLTGFGQDGPLKSVPAYDHIVQGLSGMMSLTGEQPTRIGYPVVDYMAGLQAAFAIVAGLRHRDRTGRGLHVDVSMLDTALIMMAPFVQQQLQGGDIDRPPQGAAFSGSPFSGTFRTRDEMLVVTANTLPQAHALCTVIERMDLMDDPRMSAWNSHPELLAEVQPICAAIYASNRAAHWERLLQRASVPAARVTTLGDALASAQVSQRGLLEPAIGDSFAPEPMTVLGPGVRFDTLETESNRAPPRLGENSRQILTELGLRCEQVDALIENGVVLQA